MPITEETRRQLHDTVAQHLGPDAAAQLMEVTIPANTELATRADLDLLRAELRAEMGELRVEMSELRAELQLRVTALEAQMKGLGDALTGAVEVLRSERRTDMAQLRTDFLWKGVPLFSGIVIAIVGVAGLLVSL